MTGSWVVRTPKAHEHSRIAWLTVDTFVGEGFSPPEAAASLGDLGRRVESSEILIAVDGESGEIVGAVSLILDGGPFAQLSQTDEAEVRFLTVDPRVRRRGAGDALTRECIRRAAEAGKTAIVLSTQPTMAAAQRLYERLGFVRTPIRDWETRDRRQMFAYQLDLSVGPATP